MTMMSVHVHARMLACMHTIFSAKLGQIGKIEISTESEGHAGHDYYVCACARQHVPMLVCMNSILWRAQAHISVQSGLIREIKVSME